MGTDAVVVGAGIDGTAAAARLAAGGWRVTLADGAEQAGADSLPDVLAHPPPCPHQLGPVRGRAGVCELRPSRPRKAARVS